MMISICRRQRVPSYSAALLLCSCLLLSLHSLCSAEVGDEVLDDVDVTSSSTNPPLKGRVSNLDMLTEMVLSVCELGKDVYSSSRSSIALKLKRCKEKKENIFRDAMVATDTVLEQAAKYVQFRGFADLKQAVVDREVMDDSYGALMDSFFDELAKKLDFAAKSMSEADDRDLEHVIDPAVVTSLVLRHGQKVSHLAHPEGYMVPAMPDGVELGPPYWEKPFAADTRFEVDFARFFDHMDSGAVGSAQQEENREDFWREQAGILEKDLPRIDRATFRLLLSPDLCATCEEQRAAMEKSAVGATVKPGRTERDWVVDVPFLGRDASESVVAVAKLLAVVGREYAKGETATLYRRGARIASQAIPEFKDGCGKGITDQRRLPGATCEHMLEASLLLWYNTQVVSNAMSPVIYDKLGSSYAMSRANDDEVRALLTEGGAMSDRLFVFNVKSIDPETFDVKMLRVATEVTVRSVSSDQGYDKVMFKVYFDALEDVLGYLDFISYDKMQYPPWTWGRDYKKATLGPEDTWSDGYWYTYVGYTPGVIAPPDGALAAVGRLVNRGWSMLRKWKR